MHSQVGVRGGGRAGEGQGEPQLERIALLPKARVQANADAVGTALGVPSVGHGDRTGLVESQANCPIVVRVCDAETLDRGVEERGVGRLLRGQIHGHGLQVTADEELPGKVDHVVDRIDVERKAHAGRAGKGKAAGKRARERDAGGRFGPIGRELRTGGVGVRGGSLPAEFEALAGHPGALFGRLGGFAKAAGKGHDEFPADRDRGAVGDERGETAGAGVGGALGAQGGGGESEEG